MRHTETEKINDPKQCSGIKKYKMHCVKPYSITKNEMRRKTRATA